MSQVFREGESENGQHSLERILGVIDTVIRVWTMSNQNGRTVKGTKTYAAKRSGRSR